METMNRRSFLKTCCGTLAGALGVGVAAHAQSAPVGQDPETFDGLATDELNEWLATPAAQAGPGALGLSMDTRLGFLATMQQDIVQALIEAKNCY